MAPAYPYPGCIVEYLEDNSVHIGMVIEDSGGKLRLLLPNRREVKLPGSRVLPWLGPIYPADKGKEEIIQILENHKKIREEKAAAIPVIEAWELAQGEIDNAKASWIAELMETGPGEDTVAAYGRALLNCKTHFRFAPPDFLIYDEATVNQRREEEEARRAREQLAATGNSFIKLLWDVAVHKRKLPAPDDPVFPPPDLQARIKKILQTRMINPDSQEDESLWQIISRGLPDEPHIPVRLLMAWGIVPRHYNFWLDRADYAAGDEWWQEEKETVAEFAEQNLHPQGLPFNPLPFVSMDGPSTFDIDDAFHMQKTPDGYEVTLAFANPAHAWPFGSDLDKAVMQRATSIYLPEGDLHMLPQVLGVDACSLLEKKKRKAFCVKLKFDANGECLECNPSVNIIEVAANLRYGEVQALLEGRGDDRAGEYETMLRTAHEFAQLREKYRISRGAVILLREDPHLVLHDENGETTVELVPDIKAREAQRIVSELMIVASAAIADWASERQIPLLHRTQNVALPREYAGVWESPEDQALIIRSLMPSTLEIASKPHAALGVSRYAQITSPLRRYPDLVNEAQILYFLETGSYLFDASGLETLMHIVSMSLDSASQVQKFRPRYWKLLYFRQQGENVWYDGIVTEENETMVTVSLPTENITVRGRRNLFGDRIAPGLPLKLRLGKVNPLLNDIHILEVLPEE